MPNRDDPKRIQARPKMFITLRTKFRLPILSFWILIVVTASNQATICATDKYRNMINCDIHQNACTRSLPACIITLEINPKPVKAMKDLLFRVTLSGNPPLNIKAPFIDLGMPGMNMGPNRVMLKSVAPGVYEGKGIIVRCPSGRRIWRATVTIPDIGQAEFIFNVIY